MENLTHNQQLFISILALAKMPDLLLEAPNLSIPNKLKLELAKLDSNGFIIEFAECKEATIFINSVIETLLRESDTYGTKRYANRKTIALRVSLTGTI
jgi:hypothetical protein